MAEQKPKPKPTCYTCGYEIVFDRNITSPTSGKMIPLDPDTKKPHECQEVKAVPKKEVLPVAEEKPQEYVDHTLARPSEVKIFTSIDTEKLAEEYKQFQKGKKFAWSRAQYQAAVKNNELVHSIAFYYEEAK